MNKVSKNGHFLHSIFKEKSKTAEQEMCDLYFKVLIKEIYLFLLLLN